ncbi:MAG: hypothetical protein GY711_01910 [bacterium]|nr:hypothetical protein [bacterium]
MQTSVIVALVAGLAGGAVGAGVSGLVFTPSSGTTTDTASAVAPEVPVGDIVDQLAALRESNAALQRRLDMLEMTPRTNADARSAIEAPEAVEVEQELKQLVATLKDPSKPIPGFENHVRQAMESIEEQERQEREAKRAEEREKRLEDRLAGLTSELGLDKFQVGEMRRVLGEEGARRDTFLTKMREDGQRPNREAWGELREQTQTELGKVLTPTQLETYNESNSDRWGRGGRGGGGRRGGD